MKFCEHLIFCFLPIFFFLSLTGSAFASSQVPLDNPLPDDLHIHAGGSYPLEVLKTVAEKHMRPELYEEFLKGYEIIKNRTLEGKERWDLFTKQFILINQIMSDLDDIRYGTAAIVRQHPSSYLELRSSLKRLNGSSFLDYARAFAEGIDEVNQELNTRKANGLLSIDRTKHSFDEANEIIRIALQLRNEGKPISGIDISGLPGVKRTLGPRQLTDIIESCLQNALPLAIHLGESDDSLENKDADAVLQWLENKYEDDLKNNPHHFRGLIRLGHVTHFTERQLQIIRKLGLSIEICPTCHEQTGWWDGLGTHQVHRIYPQSLESICYGSDDPTIFAFDIRDDMNRFHSLLRAPVTPSPEHRFNWGVDFEEDLRQLTEHERNYLNMLQRYPNDHGYFLTSLPIRIQFLLVVWNLIQK